MRAIRAIYSLALIVAIVAGGRELQRYVEGFGESGSELVMCAAMPDLSQLASDLPAAAVVVFDSRPRDAEAAARFYCARYALAPRTLLAAWEKAAPDTPVAGWTLFDERTTFRLERLE